MFTPLIKIAKIAFKYPIKEYFGRKMILVHVNKENPTFDKK